VPDVRWKDAAAHELGEGVTTASVARNQRKQKLQLQSLLSDSFIENTNRHVQWHKHESRE
jgi:hypothetical protein